MNNDVPTVDGYELVNLLEEFGWEVVLESRKHTIMVKTGSNQTLTIPKRNPLAAGALRALIARSGMRQPARLLFEN